ncbi:MAG: hypothetical protein HETSPECPRED_007230 [Heterodermia speciosa]|uniref:Uncharacterized protein n=1 Tax=Heterodermia speciosa TaxID=116794 RepID=A0A8H3HYH0_9LECA|nr:MAG: hypothetical protein HETSPECPRED_007230 [Heterodermia speciosa]
MASPCFYLLGLPYDIRCQIYETFYPVAKHIKITSGPVSEETAHKDSTICRLSPEAINLMRVCRQINDEITVILYGTNTFFMVPGEPLPVHPSQNSLRWLHDLRSSTKQMVKKLDIHVGLRMNRSSITEFVSGVSNFPTLEIRVVPELRLSEKEMREICDGVMEMRGSAQTTWNSMGCILTAVKFYFLNIIGTTGEILRKSGGGSRWTVGGEVLRRGEGADRWTVSGDEWTQNKMRRPRNPRYQG